MTNITVLSYAHNAHRCWVKHWANQLNQQTYRDFDTLFIPHNWNGSTHKDKYRIISYVDEIVRDRLDDDIYSRLKIVPHWGEPVVGDVINFARTQIKTEFVANWDVDDLIHPDRIRKQFDFLEENNDIDFLGARGIGFWGDNPEWPDLYENSETSLLIKYLNDPELQSHEQIKQCFTQGLNCLPHSTMTYRIRALDALGGFSMSHVKKDNKSPDEQTWRKAISAGYKFHRLPEILMLWRLNSTSQR